MLEGGTSGITNPAMMLDPYVPRGAKAADKAIYVVNRFLIARAKRATWDGHWQDIKELVRPDTLDFNRQMVPGYRRYDLIFDGTACKANEELAGGLHSYLTSPTERWFELAIKGGDGGWCRDEACLRWLEAVSDIIYDEYSNPFTRLNACLHEGYLDLGAFGSLVLCQEWSYENGGHLLFKSFPLADCYYMHNSEFIVDTLFRYFTYTGRNIIQEFGEEAVKKCPKIWKNINEPAGIDREFKIIHAVYPRPDGDIPLEDDRPAKEFCSVYCVEQTREILEDKYYDEFPFHISRWLMIAGEVYGRGPAMTCLPDIKSLNMMEKIILKAAQKAIDPPLMVPDDGFLLPIKTAPGSLNFKEPGTEKIEALEFKGNVQMAIDYPNQKREYIKKCFYSDWLKMGKENKEMTAYETADRRDQMLRQMSPMLGRQQSELLGPMLCRTYNLLRRAGRIPSAPEMIRKRKLCVNYISPAARAQQAVRGQQMGQLMQDMMPMLQVDPTIIDAIDMDRAVQILATIRGVPRSILRSPQQLQQKRDDRQKQQQMQQMMENAKPMSDALKNVQDVQRGNSGQ